jgi:phage terminase large subunit-like protein
VPVIKELLNAATTVITRGATLENRSNLAPSFLKQITERYAGTRLGRQELEAEVLDDNPNALWTRDLIDRALTKDHPTLLRTVVAIDPSGTDGQGEGDDIGVVAAGLGSDGKMYVLADATLQASPANWGKAAVKLYHDLKADRIVGERNFGGAMVAHVIRTIDGTVAYKEVTASRGKWLRAEPVAALYEQGRVKHVGGFARLEDEMCSFGPDGKSDGKSPNRLDALVWAATELMLGDGASVFESAEDDFIVAPIDIPRHWRRVFALEVTHNRVACLWGALEQGSDTVYLCSEYVARRQDLAVHAAAIRDRGEWVPGVINPIGAGQDERAGRPHH